MTLPEQFCWTRFGTEAAQTIDQILERKEQERLANNGCFFWGIGNAVGPSMLELLRCNSKPEVLFSPIKGTPRAQDVAPESVVVWTQGQTLNGQNFRMPESALVTSRYDPSNPRSAHYALVCSSENPLKLAATGQTIHFGELRNILTRRPVGASQVTSVVCRVRDTPTESRKYNVALRVRLVAPYLVRLGAPVPIPAQSASFCNNGNWAEGVRAMWEFLHASHGKTQLALPGISLPRNAIW